MLGSHETTDAAAQAVIKAHSSSPDDSATGQKLKADKSYVTAIQTLRGSLDASDSTLVAVGLLTLYEMIRKDQPEAFFSHAGGMSAILRARMDKSAVTSVMRAAFYNNSYATFQEPLSNGTASPFDDPFWLDLEPATITSLSKSAARLRKLSNQTFIRLPGLISKARQLREKSAAGWPDETLLKQTCAIANNLLQQQDSAAESDLLHQVSVKPTIDPFDKVVVPYSFSIDSYNDKETLLVYWGSRLMVLKLCLVLDDLQEAITPPGSNHKIPPSFNVRALSAEQDRLVMSILMFWQDGFGQANCFSMVWGALMGRKEFRGKPVTPIRRWVLRRYHDSLKGWPVQYSMADMDEEADVMAGGPLTGWLVKQPPNDGSPASSCRTSSV
jgi:hypothetical protein